VRLSQLWDRLRDKQARRRALRHALRVCLFAALALTLLLSVAGVWIFMAADDSLASDLSRRTVNDITQLNPIQVGRVETPRSVAEIARLLRATTGPVSIGGARCSMGGQIADEGSLHLDMRQMNKVVSLAPEQRLITVQAGIRWRDIQDAIDPHDLSIKIMQTYANFTVGGALSVNAHGRYMGRGPVVQSVRSIKLVLADGEVVDASPQQRPELFFGAIGGYGGLGVIAEATLELADNDKVERRTETMAMERYAAYFAKKIRNDPDVVFHNADLHPPAFDTLRAVSWVRSKKALTDETRLIPRAQSYTWTPLLINNTVAVPFGFALRKYLLEPAFYAGDAVTWRNHEASYDIQELEPDSRLDETFVLREYFIPAEQFAAFVPKLRDVFQKHDVKVINVSVRHASADPGTLLAWARGETFAFVVYYVQGTSKEERDAVGRWSRELVDAALSLGGTYYLPYQIHNTRSQFQRAYPRAEEFFALKRTVDPELRFQNALWNAYGPSPRAELSRALAKAKYERKPEGQTLLTVPEWYLVFNPLEYAEHLARKRPSDTFPFIGSLTEYWSLYKKVLRLSRGVYPDNDEYLTMLRVIGVSTTVEYLIKGAYEATIGWLSRLTSDAAESEEDRIIAAAYRAYSDLIYDKAWYEFEFSPWVSKIWGDTGVFGANFVRRSERKLAFSAEFLVKAAYAELLGFAARASYDAPVETVALVVEAAAPEALRVDPRVRVGPPLPAGRSLISVPRWGGFSALVPKLAERGVRFVELGGNDDIAISVLLPRGRRLPRALGQHLFDSRLVTDPQRTRSVLFVPAGQLSATLRALPQHGAQLEHLYDY
jgi:FAD/FMN-containing dehydrogenase